MNRRRVLVNSALGLALVGVGVVGFVSLSHASAANEPTGRTVAVTRGTLTSTVTASGNLETATSVELQLSGSGGTVKAIYVKEGQKVTKGQKLLKISDKSAKEGLETAKASLASAKAQYATATQGRSAADQEVDSAGVRTAKTSLANAKTAKSAAEDSYDLDKRQQAKLVDAAEDDVSDAKAKKKADEAALKAAQTKLQADRAVVGGDPSTVTTDETAVNTLTSSVGSDSSAVSSAESALTKTRQARDSTLLKDKQAVKTQAGQEDSAEDALSAQRASAAANQQPARKGAVNSAQAQIDSAQVSVDQAQRTLDDTVLRAPQAGVVGAISAVKGESSSSSSSSSSGSSGSDSTEKDSGSSTTSSSTSSQGSGLITLVDLQRKQVTASVAEADATLVKVGQPATAVFSASGQSVDGTVTAIDTESTVTDNVVEYDVTIGLGPVSSSLRLGQTVSVTITTASKSDVLIVPTSTLSSVDGHGTVTRRSNGADTQVNVETGLVGATGTEVTSGLAEGDQIVVPTGGSGSRGVPGASSSASSSASSTPR